MDAWATLTLVVSSKATIALTSLAPNLLSSSVVSQAQSKTYGPFGVPMTVVITAVDQGVTYALAGNPGGLSYNADGGVNGFTGASSEIIAISEVTAYVAATASDTTTVLTGAGEYAGYLCTVAAGNITVYDNTAASGRVIVPLTALVVGAFPIFGAGTNGRLALATGCTVVLSGAATVVALVQ